MALQKVCILGTGGVGAELARQIVRDDGPGMGHDNPTSIIGMANRGGYVLSPDGIRDVEPHLASRDAFTQGTLRDLVAAIDALGLTPEVVFVDATAVETEAMLRLHQEILSLRGKMVTANKNPLSRFSFADFTALTRSPRQYRYGPTVMAGAGIVGYLQELRHINDPVKTIDGCFSGTLGFILSELEKGERGFSEIVRDARARGFTEPHPWDDLNGLDVARKLLILARTAGFRAELSDVRVDPLVGSEYGRLSDPDAFLGALPALDEAFAASMRRAAQEGNTLRYVAQLRDAGNGKADLSVGLRPVPKASPLGSLQGPANLVQVVTHRGRAPEKSPHVIMGQGAGAVVTAEAVRVELAHLLPELTLGGPSSGAGERLA